MTQVGHILTGIAVGVACMPESKSKKWKSIFLAIFGAIANIPDFQLPYWGHHRYYYVSHSLFVNGLIILLILPVFAFNRKLREKIGGWKVVVGGIVAWLSHLLLDTFYNQEKGLLMLWPFSDARVSLPMSWFSVVKTIPPPLTADTVHILLVEAVFYGTILLFVILLRKNHLLPWLRDPSKPPKE
jgi:membrane-bound metal-dependent hydrolase YbcI (DUF457 family)